MARTSATNVYIDGFNLYYGSVKGTPYKWLDLEAFCRHLLPAEQITKIHYFTARVSGKVDPGAPNRQAIFLRALATLPLVEVHFGTFLTHTVWMPLAKPPARGMRKAQVVKTEEKGSDVNLASHLLLDCARSRCQTVVVVSNDSDLVEPLRMARAEFGVKVGVINPHPPKRRSRELSNEAHFFKQVRPAALAASQFPPTLVDATGRFHKPPAW